MTPADRPNPENRLLVLATTSKDAALTKSILSRAGVDSLCCENLEQICAQLDSGASAVLLVEEAVTASRGNCLSDWLARQPSWSDLPVLVLARPGADSAAVAQAMDLLGNVTVLERPTRVAALVSAVRSALRARQRQYEARAHLSQIECSERDLSDFFDNASVGLHWVGPDGIILRVNQTELDMLGYAREEYVGRHIAEFHANLPVIHDILARLARGETLRDFPARMRAKDGSVRDVLINSNVLFQDGVFVHTRSFTRDVTEQKQAEQALRESEEFNRSLMDGSADCVKVMDLDGRLLLMNAPGMCQMEIDDFGLVCGAEWWSLWPAETCETIRRSVERARTGETSTFQSFCPTAKGSPRWWDVTVSPVRAAAGGNIVRLLSVSRDITERKRAEQQLRESEERFRAMADNIPQLAWMADGEGWIFWYNQQWYDYTGTTLEQMQGWGWKSVHHPDHIDRVVEKVALHFREGLDWEDTFPLRGTDGQYRWFLSRMTPIRDKSGRIARFFGTNTDITAQREVEQALRETQTQLQSELTDTKLLQTISAELIHLENAEALYDKLLDAATNIMRSGMASMQVVDESQNGLRLLAFRGFEPEFGKVFALGLPDTRTSCSVAWQQGHRVIVPDVEACDFIVGTPSLEAHRKSGIRAIQSTPLISRGGKLVGMISTHWSKPHQPSERDLRLLDILARQAADLIERNSAEQALREADRRKDEFLAVLAHELRNPLAPIRNSLHILRMTSQHDPAAQRVGEMLERQVNHMVRLVDDLLEVSRITRGKIELRKESLEVAAIVRSAVEASAPLIEAAGHQLALAIPPEPLTIEGDPVRLTQVIANLLNNAAKYTDAGGQIWLTARQEGQSVAISVRDTGTGIPPAMLPRVFDLFTQVDRHLERAQGGLGIGLTLVKSLVEMHGGTVQARSEGTGRGSEFIVRLPLTMVPRPAVIPGQPLKRSTVLASRRVLVVDDNRDAAESLGMLLKFLGADVHIVCSGPDAFEALETFQPSTVLLDIGMPGMDGYEVARRIRQDARHRGITLIALTGWGQEEDRRRSQDAGFDHHLIKPAELTALQTLLVSLEDAPESHRLEKPL